jgi:hypothetical protein
VRVLCRSWFTDEILIITIVNSTGADDPLVTRTHTLTFTIHPDGGLKMEANRTLATNTTIPFAVNGTWVRYLSQLTDRQRCLRCCQQRRGLCVVR